MLSKQPRRDRRGHLGLFELVCSVFDHRRRPWLLDVATNDALCLRWRGERQTFSIVEDQQNILVHYDATFSVNGDNFDVISENPAIGRRTIVADYPAREIDTYTEIFRRRISP